MTKQNKDLIPVAIEAGLDSAALAKYANFDLEQFKDLKLDILDQTEIFSNDILIPKVWLAQQMSELVKQQQAISGQFVDSQTSEILAEVGQELKFVVLKTFKRWHTFKLVRTANKVKKEFVSSEIMTLKNAGLPYEEFIDGEEIIRRQVISSYILLERDAVKGINKPYIIDFASSSKLGGRKMVSDIKTLNSNGLPSFVGFFRMIGVEEQFDEGSAFVKSVSFGGYLPKESMPFLIKCVQDLKAIEEQIVIDDRDIVEVSVQKRDEGKVSGNIEATEAGV